MKKMLATTMGFAAAVATFAVATPAADAANYAGSIPTFCNMGPNRYYVLAGQHAYAVGRVQVPGNAMPQGVVSATWNGNTGGNYAENKYRTDTYVYVGPVTPRRGTYAVQVYYTPTRGSVYQSCSQTFTQVITRSRRLAAGSAVRSAG